MAPVVLDVADVRVARAGRDLLAGVSLRVRAAEHWALIGPNGAGKTTLLTLCGALGHPTSGTVDVLGRRLGRVDLSELRRRIGHVDPRHRMLRDNTVHEVVLTGLTGSSDPVARWSPTPAEEARARSLTASVGLGARSTARWSVLSQGERGRALIARALLASPALLLLDEPATGLDVAAREHLLDTLDEVRASHPDVASVTVTHHLEDLPASTSHAVLLRDGRVFAQGPADDVLTSELVSAAFDHPLVIERVAGRWSARTRRGRPASSM
ncbi:ATP-binding cassette domain-containing protein [Frigoribacterium sp. CFBP 13712]|nr:ATP-binding cassette domain-containing protein [Frigoribacterium sp. CFBP 13712]